MALAFALALCATFTGAFSDLDSGVKSAITGLWLRDLMKAQRRTETQDATDHSRDSPGYGKPMWQVVTDGTGVN